MMNTIKMRLKTIPRQRRPNYSRTPTRDNEHMSSTDVTQDVDSHKHGQMLGGLMNHEVLNDAIRNESVHFLAKKNSQKINCGENNEAVNLSTKNGRETVEKNEIPRGSMEKFTGTVLYQIMTDPTFVENIKNDKEAKKLTCKFCKKKFRDSSELVNHLDSRLDELDRIKCCACHKTFGQKRYLRYHQRCHVVNDKFTCEICMKTYSRMDNLSRHKTYHTNPDKYSCKICKKTFSRRDLMTKHIKSHGGKMLNCDNCKTVFNNFASLKAHKLVCAQKTKENGSIPTED